MRRSIYQSDGYDIVVVADDSDGGMMLHHRQGLHHHSHNNPNDFTLLIQIDTTVPSSSNVTNTTTTTKHAPNHPPTLPTPLGITSGSVIGRLELSSVPPITSSSSSSSINTTGPTNPHIKLDYQGTEYIGQIVPGPTAMLLSLVVSDHPEEPRPPKNNGTSSTDAAAASTEMKITNDDTVPAVATVASQSSSTGVLVVDHIMNEFCSMIPISHDTSMDHGVRRLPLLPNTAASGNSTTTTTTGSYSNVDYFQYSDDIYDVNKIVNTTTKMKRPAAGDESHKYEKDEDDNNDQMTSQRLPKKARKQKILTRHNQHG
jgi:hypothetical protein